MTATAPVTDAVYSFKLLDALRKGDQATLHPFLSKVEAKSDQPIPELISPLHLAVRCAEYSTVELLLTYKSISPNVIDASTGNTPLHLACSIPRPDVVALLLRQPDIDDTKRNFDGLDCLGLAKDIEVAHAIQVSRAELNMHYLQLLSVYEKSPLQASNSSANLTSSSPSSSNSQALKAADAIYSLLESPRYSALDLNAQSLDSGTTLLHEAVRRKDMRMIETAIRKGADVFGRDRKGKRALESTKDEKVKALLRQFSNSDPALANQAAPGQPPVFRGYMGKWTNMAGGYKTRWFVLENGVLSYYHNQEEEGKQSRGSINMRFAKVRADSNDKHRFEVISDSGKGSTKLYLKGSHPVERARWVQVLSQTQDFFKLERTTSRESTSTTPAMSLNPSANTSTTNLASTSTAPSTTFSKGFNSALPATTLSRATSLLGAPSAGVPAMTGIVPNQAATGSSRSSAKSVAGAVGPGVNAPYLPSAGVSNRSPSILSRNDSHSPSSEKDGFDLDEGLVSQLPYEGQYSLVENSLRAQVELSLQLIESVGASAATSLPPANGSGVNGNSAAPAPALTNLGGSGVPAGGNSALRLSKDLTKTAATSSSASSITSSHSSSDARQALASSLQSTSTLLNQLLSMTQAREAYLQRRWEQEIRAKTLWEENMTTLARQHSEMEEQLREAVQENARKRKALREVRETFGSTPGSTIGSPLPPSRSVTNEEFSTPTGSLAARRAGGENAPLAQALKMDSPLPAPTALAGVSDITNEELERSSKDDQDEAEDDFFDAIESGDLPGLKVQTPLLDAAGKEENWPSDFDQTLVDEEAMGPYRKLRTKMPLGKDDRPSVSLWAILKNNIGKDLTKISFPVSFNEPTSMLQRMAEDMEFSECLDAASLQTDSALRTAFVAAFAMSNYSSTIGRVAKPFNPLLGETFEYARFDKHYRYVSEQVSHHPPISACHAQSPSWSYMGCVDAKSKFLGRTFEIRPTGVAHVQLRIPNDLAPDLPLIPEPDSKRVIEHFSWNKVTTSVSGFIVGQPTIDHFGDMEVTNHHTKEKCVLTFKPRGWRGKDAYEIKGAVYDKNGKQSWEIAGRWNSQLVARRFKNGGSGDLNPDEKVSGDGPPLAQVGDQAHQDEYVLLWKNSVKPPTPFNLTPFAITLNQLSTELRPWLAPTDCRLRPDLSAFESGKFDQANDYKAGLENYQRETRKKRENGDLPPHKPRWFKASIDPDTDEQIWEPLMKSYPHKPGVMVPEYWQERSRVGKAKVEAIKNNQQCKADWQDCLHIFGDYEAPEPTAH